MPADWLVEREVTLVGMEATGVYWKPVHWVLEGAIDNVWVINARHMRNVPGRKTDVADAAWGAQLIEHGLVRPSFIPDRPGREQRDLTRYRKSVIEERGRETQRLHKVLEDAGVKLSSVASKVLTKWGREMIDALIAGQRDPEVLAEMAKGRMRSKIPELKDALAGRFNAHHALLCRAMLARIDQADATIDELTTAIEKLLDAEAGARGELGRYGTRAAFRWDVTAEDVGLTVYVRSPSLLPAVIASPLGLDVISRGVVVRRERVR